MTDDRKQLMEELKNALEKFFDGTQFEVNPLSPTKYKDETGTAFKILLNGKKICGVEAQITSPEAPFKIWFSDNNLNKLWETKLFHKNVKPANNGFGLGSGCGFYVSSVDEVITEISAYIFHNFRIQN